MNLATHKTFWSKRDPQIWSRSGLAVSEILRFLYFGISILKLPIHAHFFGGGGDLEAHFPQMTSRKKDHPCMETSFEP